MESAMDENVQPLWMIFDALKVEGCTPKTRAVPFYPREDDVILASAAKGGTTWMQQILHQIRSPGDETYDDISAMVPWVPPYDWAWRFDPDAEQVASPRIFKVHETYENCPKFESKTRFVVTIRNPYDAAYSALKYFARSYKGIDKDLSVEEYIETMERTDQLDLASFTASWWRQRDNPNVLIIPYEEMKRDLPTCIQKLSNFLYGHPVSEPALSKITHLCSFEYMSNNAYKFVNVSDRRAMWQKIGKEYRPVVTLGRLVRVGGGQVGQGAANLDEAIRREIDKRWKVKMEKEFGCKSYQDLYAEWKKRNAAIVETLSSRDIVSGG